MTRSACAAWQRRLNSSALPFPTQKTGSGFGRFCKTRSTVSAPAVLASSSSSSSDSSLSMPTSTARSRPVRVAGLAARYAASVRSISASHSSCGRRRALMSSVRRTCPSLSASRKAHCTLVGLPSSLTPTAHMASKRMLKSALTSTSLNSPVARGCVCTQRTMLSRRSPRRRRKSGRSMLSARPMSTSATSPKRVIYTAISRFMDAE